MADIWFFTPILRFKSSLNSRPHPGRTRDRQFPLLRRPNDTGLHGRTSPNTRSHWASNLSSRFQACRQDSSSRTMSTIVPGASSLSCSTFVWLATACPNTSRALSCCRELPTLEDSKLLPKLCVREPEIDPCRGGARPVGGPEAAPG